MAATPLAVKIATNDGATNTLILYLHNEKPNTPIILCMPAMGVLASFYHPLGEAFQQSGLQFATADLRGNGESSIRASRRVNFGYGEIIHHEIPAFIAAIRDHCPQSPIYLLGHSLGGQLNTLYLAESASSVQGMILVAASNIYYKGYAQPLKMLASSQFLNVVSKICGYLPGNTLGFGGREARQLISEWAHCARTGRYNLKYDGVSLEKKLKDISLPVLAISFEEDWRAPREAVINLYKKLTSADIAHQHLKGHELGIENLDHFNWVKQPDILVERIHNWLCNLETTSKPDVATNIDLTPAMDAQ